ncbi:MAG: hypothetical protein QM668_03185 [Agriterribacter sp.]
MKQLKQLENQSVRNKYYWKLSSALCRFQAAVPDLLLVLQDIDRTGSGFQTSLLTDAMNEMKASFENLCAVQRETRFIK